MVDARKGNKQGTDHSTFIQVNILLLKHPHLPLLAKACWDSWISDLTQYDTSYIFMTSIKGDSNGYWPHRTVNQMIQRTNKNHQTFFFFFFGIPVYYAVKSNTICILFIKINLFHFLNKYSSSFCFFSVFRFNHGKLLEIHSQLSIPHNKESKCKYQANQS